MQFKNLKGAAISAQATVKYTFWELQGEPWLMVKPAGETNRPYFSAVLKKNTSGRRRMLSKSIDAATIERLREEDRELYGKHVANGGSWGLWLDEITGVEVPYSQVAVEALMQGLPADQFDDLRNYCNDLSNFRQDVVSADAAEETGKNS